MISIAAIPATAPAAVKGIWCNSSRPIRFNMMLDLYFFITAFAALSEKFQEMAVYCKIRLLRKLAFQVIQSAISKINHLAAVRANKVMVMLCGAAHQITPAAAAGMDFADITEFGQDFQRPVNGYQTDTGVFKKNTFVNGRRGQVFTITDNCGDNGSALRGYFITGEVRFQSSFLNTSFFNTQLKIIFIYKYNIQVICCQ
jgi:hypothetical protein